MILVIFLSSCSENNCRLTDGKYNVIYDNEFSEFQYEIASDSIREIYQDQIVLSKLERISDSEYFISDLASHLTYKDDSLKELYTYKKPFYRLTYCRNDTIGFEMIRNTHNIVNSGKLIKIE